MTSTRADSQSDRRPGAAPPLFTTLKDDVRHVYGEVQRHGIKHSVAGTFTTLETFYLTDADRERLSELRPLRRWLRRTWWLLKGLLMKLTPTRRVLLVAALVAWLIGTVRIDIGGAVFEGRPAPIATAVLLFILMLELRDKLVARDELEAGRAVQLALMPAHKPEIPGWNAWLYTRPANDVGGDLVDHLRMDERQHFVALGDVAGKALPAALLSVKLQATLRALAPRFSDLGELGGALNQILQRDGLPSRFASLVYLLVSEDSGRVRLLNAGHMPPLLVSNGQVTTLERGSMVLGMMPDVTFSEQRVELTPGDSLVVYSDGITEAMNESGDFFGDDRLLAVVRQSAGLPPELIGARVLDAVASFVGEAVPNDDVSLIVLKRA
jgi:serine phosphatase RsbU (regulator of sigma subunit)